MCLTQVIVSVTSSFQDSTESAHISIESVYSFQDSTESGYLQPIATFTRSDDEYDEVGGSYHTYEEIPCNVHQQHHDDEVHDQVLDENATRGMLFKIYSISVCRQFVLK